MEVYRLRLNSNSYQSFLPADTRVWEGDALKLACRSKTASWEPPDVYVDNPLLPAGNFLHLCSGGLVVDAYAMERLRTVLEMAGELLPLSCGGTPYWLLNVLDCANCLDDASSTWVLGRSTGAKIRIEEYRFHRDRFHESTLFKIPETAHGEILTISGRACPDDEFKPIVEREGLTGLLFERLWCPGPAGVL